MLRERAKRADPLVSLGWHPLTKRMCSFSEKMRPLWGNLDSAEYIYLVSEIYAKIYGKLLKTIICKLMSEHLIKHFYWQSHI